MLVLNIQRMKKSSFEGYKTSWSRNMHERTDAPVFNLEDAVSQLKQHYSNTDSTIKDKRTEVEKAMDFFFLNNLPEAVLNPEKNIAKENPSMLEINEENLRKQKREMMKKENFNKKGKKYQSVHNLETFLLKNKQSQNNIITGTRKDSAFIFGGGRESTI